MHWPGSTAMKRVSATGRWSVTIPDGLTVVDNGESWQAHDTHRIVYVSSLAVSGADGRPKPAREIAEVAGRKLPPGPDREQKMQEGSPALVGAAVIQPATNLGWELRGYMAGDGTLALCVIDYDTPGLREWAVENLAFTRVEWVTKEPSSPCSRRLTNVAADKHFSDTTSSQ